MHEKNILKLLPKRTISVCFLFILVFTGACKKEVSTGDKYTVAAFYWPAYHYEPKAEFLFPDKKGEWEIIYNATPKEEGHMQPKVPLWGYVDEADPKVMDKKIETAVNYGVDVFIFDWYWYQGQPFLEDCVDNGFIKANNDRMKFYLMWANHDATTYWDVDNPSVDSVIWQGEVNRQQFNAIVDRVIEKYFKNPSYYKIDGEPVFCIYELNTLINGLGGAEETKQALDYLRQKTIDAGFPGVHLQSILWSALPSSLSGVPGERIESQDEVLSFLGFNSLTNYCWAHLQRPDGDYEKWADASTVMWQDFLNDFSISYFPNVTISWDANPRFLFKSDYIINSTPEKFGRYVRKAKDFVDQHQYSTKLITVNAWNEWSEGSYLEPDTIWKYGYLEALKEAVGGR